MEHCSFNFLFISPLNLFHSNCTHILSYIQTPRTKFHFFNVFIIYIFWTSFFYFFYYTQLYLLFFFISFFHFYREPWWMARWLGWRVDVVEPSFERVAAAGGRRGRRHVLDVVRRLLPLVSSLVCLSLFWS